jgi:serine protease Do
MPFVVQSTLMISRLGTLFALCVCLFGETVKDREGAVREDRSRMENDPLWIYNDWRKGLDEARHTGRPLLVVLRCVPCLACMGIDASVLSEPDLRPLLDEFIRVRVINANALDLSLFQFDYDLSFSTLFFNGDGTIYGRFGSWTHQKNAHDKTTESFKRALEGALALHREYPNNKEALKGKQGKAMPVNDPLDLPELAGKYKRELDWRGKVVQSCVHCHQIGDGVRSLYRKDGVIPRQWIYPMPMPETIGLTLAPNEAATIEKVVPNSIAAQAGVRPGDEVIELAGQPLISSADLSWVLHHAPEGGSLRMRVERSGESRELTLTLPNDWRLKSDISRRVATWPMRAMALGGLLLESLSADERHSRPTPKDQMALLVKHAGEYGIHAAAKKAGFQKGDILVSVDGRTEPITESELIGRLLEKHRPGESVKAIVLRGDKQLQLTLPMQ